MHMYTYIQSISVLAINGADEILADEQFYLMMYELYTTTVRKMWGTQYLNAEFFLKLHQVLRVCVCMYVCKCAITRIPYW